LNGTILSVSLTPVPTSPEETLREAPGGRIAHSWVCFCFDGDSRGEAESGRTADRYRLEAVNLVRGPQAAVRSGQTVLRMESNGVRPPAAAPGSMIGTVEAHASSAPDAQAELARRWSASRWRVALLVPFTLTPAWWRLPREERTPAHLCWTQGISESSRLPITTRALRALYRARSAPDAEWDYLAYLEMQPHDVAPIREALAELRDPRRNPAFHHVERIAELWMTKDLSAATRRI
jgi:hypothetical protein